MTLYDGTAPGRDRPAKGTLSMQALDDWLEEQDLDWTASMIDGYLTALAIGPAVIARQVWMARIIDPESAAAQDPMAGAAQRGIFRRYLEIGKQLTTRRMRYSALFMQGEDGEILLDEWANGFLLAMQMAWSAWMPVCLNPELGMPIAIILGHNTLTDDRTWIEQLGDPPIDLFPGGMWTVIPKLVVTIHAGCRPLRKARAS